MRLPWWLRPTGWWLRSELVLIGLGERRLALSRLSQVQSLLLNYHHKLQPSWFPLFYLFGMLENLIDRSKTPWGTHGQEERSGSAAPRHLARLLESACPEEERPWEITRTTRLHLCVTLVRGMPDATGWRHGNLQRSSPSSDVISGYFHQNFCIILQVLFTRFPIKVVSFRSLPQIGVSAQVTAALDLWVQAETHKAFNTQVRRKRRGRGRWAHDTPGHLWCLNNTPCVSEGDVSVMRKGSPAPNHTKWLIYSFISG